MYVYNLSFDSARAEFKIVTRSQPEHPAGYFFLAMVEWWRIITDIENRSRDDKFIRMLDRVIDLAEKRLDKDENDITGLFFKGGALGYQGRLYGNREDWLRAANCGREALPIVQKAYKLAPFNNDVLLGIGIYNYYVAIVPEIYPWVKPLMLFFPKGEKAKGLEQLRTAAGNARYANIEAMYFLMQVYHNFERSYPEAMDIADELHKMFPNNVIFHKYVGRCLGSLGKWNESQHAYNQILRRVAEKQPGYDRNAERESNFYLGLADMNFEKLDPALQYFYRSDELSRILDVKDNSWIMVIANLKIGMIYDMQGKRDLALLQYNKILDMKEYQDSHKLAKQYSKSPYRKQ